MPPQPRQPNGQPRSSESPNDEPTLTTDREDYPPFSYVYFHGTGFQPGETVNMIVVESDPIQQSFEPWDVVADENGEFDTSWYIFSSEFDGATFQATATGQTSQLTASATFTDANGDGTMPVSPGSATPSSTGNSFTFSFRNETRHFHCEFVCGCRGSSRLDESDRQRQCYGSWRSDRDLDHSQWCWTMDHQSSFQCNRRIT